MNVEDRKERRVAWAILILCPLSMAILFIYVTLGYAPGLAAGHPMNYLQTTCVLWAVIMTVLPILRLLRLVSLPYWFLVLIYADMYMFVITLCWGFYFDYYWWPDLTHIISAMVVTSIVFMALCVIQSDSPSHVSLGTNGGVLAITLLIGFSFGAIWEIMEELTDIFSGADYMSYGVLHTMGNLTADMMGAIIMTTIAWIMLGRHDAKKIASKIRIGRKQIDDR